MKTKHGKKIETNYFIHLSVLLLIADVIIVSIDIISEFTVQSAGWE